MAIYVIESKDKALLDAFKAGLQFESRVDRKVEQGNRRHLHWLIIEDKEDEDNATYRLTRKGLRFAMAGVEI